MDLGGRAPGYRGAAIRCPGCADAMTQEVLEECEVDVCTACGGIWVDWFDGEVRKVTSDARKTARAAPGGEGLRNEAFAAGACPRCARHLAPERYVLAKEETGTLLLRCSECMGVFVSKTASEMLAMLPLEDAPSPSAPPAVDERGQWARLVSLIRRLFGGK